MNAVQRSLESLKKFLSKLINGLIVPHPSIVEIGMRRQAQFSAAIALLLSGLLFLQIITAFTSGRLELGMILGGVYGGTLLAYGLSRSKLPQLGSVLLIFGFTFFAFFLSTRRAADVNTTMYGMIPIAYVLAGVLLSTGWQILLVALVLTGSIILGVTRITPNVNMNMLGGNLVALGIILTFTSKLRDGIERRRLKQLQETNRDLEEAKIAVQESERTFRAFVEQSTDGLLLTDEQGMIIGQNLAHQQLTGLKREDVIGKPIWDMLLTMLPPEMQSPAARQRTQETVQQTLQTGQGNFVDQSHEVKIHRTDGTDTFVLQTTFIIKTELGYRLGSISHDITARKRIELLTSLRINLFELAANHSMEELLQKTLDEVGELTGSPIGFYHFVEADQKTISLQAWSTRTLKEFCQAEGKGAHYSLEQAGVWADCIRERHTIIHNDYSSLANRNGLPEGHAIVIRELVVPILRGDQIVAVLGVGNKSQEYTDKDAEIVSYLADVTWELVERKRSEGALHESQAMLRLIFENAFDGISIYEEYPEQGTRQLINCNMRYAEIAGRSREELLSLGNTLSLQKNVGSPLSHQQFLEQLAAGTCLGRFSWLRPDGRENTVEYAAVPLQMDGRVLVIGVDRDVTDQMQAAQERETLIQELQARNAELERFTYTVSHDLKSPLITIRGFLGFIEQDAQSGNMERLKADFQRIIGATDKMQSLLSELLELSRIGRLMNPPEDVPFGEVVREAIELVSGRLDARNIQVIVADDFPVVHGDRARLVEVVQNLVDNAAKFMGDQSQPQIEIGFHADEKNGSPIFFVRDNGIGIDPQYDERIFGLFDKLDAQSEGTGVGLALVKRIVEVHGGRIWVESEPGKGSTFFFALGTEPAGESH
jgi:PAS domain S-box-containing protein